MATSLRGFSEFKEGWKVVLASTIGIGLGLSPVPFYTLGMLAPELAKEFGWGFGQIMSGLTISTLVVLFSSPIVGNLADKYGVRNVILASVALFSFSFALFAFGNGSLTLFYITWGLMAALGAGTLPITWTRGVNIWFERKKGLALGLSLVGTGLFGAMIKPVAAWLIITYGWRATYLVIAAMPLLIAFPVALFCFYESPKSKSQATGTEAEVSVEKAHAGMTMSEVFRDGKFWLLCLAIIPISFAVGGPIPNMENLLAIKGFDTVHIASIVPLIGISVLFGRMIGGWLIDHFWAPGVAFVLLSLPAAACWVLGTVELNIAIAMISVFMIGFAAGVEYDLLAFLIARYFGMKSYSTIYGFVYGAFALGAGFGPMTFGIIFDKTQSYDSIMIFSACVMLVGAGLLLLLGKYRNFTTEV